MNYRTLKNKPASLYSPTSELSDIIAEFSESFKCDSVLVVNEDNSFALITFDSVLEYYKKKQKNSFLDVPLYFNELAEFSIRLMNYYYDSVRRDFNLSILELHCNRLSIVVDAEKVAFVSYDKFKSKMASEDVNNDIELYFKKSSPKPRCMTFEKKTKKSIIMPVYLLPDEKEEYNKTQALIKRSATMLYTIEKKNDIAFNKHAREIEKLFNLEFEEDLELDNATEIAQLFKISV